MHEKKATVSVMSKLSSKDQLLSEVAVGKKHEINERSSVSVFDCCF